MLNGFRNVKVAIVHDWLTGLRGGEKCLLAFLSLYPNADVYALFHVPGATSPVIDEKITGTSFLQNIPGIRRYYRYLLPLYPRAIKSISLDGYDLVISLSHAAAKNVRVPEKTRHICYCFTPMRYIWDQTEAYFGKLTPLLRPIIRSLQVWDRKGSERPDRFIAISDFVRERVRKYYSRDAEVIYPPVDTSWIQPINEYTPGEAFLCAGALVPYKRIDVAIEAFNKLGLPLWIAGSGPEEKRLRRLARTNILFLGRVPDWDLAELYRRSRALIFPGVEDFGMIPVECMASGRPVIALDEGGARETVHGLRIQESSGIDQSAVTGVFYRREHGFHSESLERAVRLFLNMEEDFSPRACIERARSFSPEKFFRRWEEVESGNLSRDIKGVAV